MHHTIKHHTAHPLEWSFIDNDGRIDTAILFWYKMYEIECHLYATCTLHICPPFRDKQNIKVHLSDMNIYDLDGKCINLSEPERINLQQVLHDYIIDLL